MDDFTRDYLRTFGQSPIDFTVTDVYEDGFEAQLVLPGGVVLGELRFYPKRTSTPKVVTTRRNVDLVVGDKVGVSVGLPKEERRVIDDGPDVPLMF